jgi:hypothetical protein
MSRKLLILAIASVFAAEAQAARYITFSVRAGLTFDITFDTNSAGTPSLSENGYTAEILPDELTIYGTPPGFLDYFTSVDLTTFDLSPSAFRYHVLRPADRWVADYIYHIQQYEFFGTTGGPDFNLTITGTDTPRPVGIAASGAIAIPSLPEPGSWAMMVGGFGLAGAALRRRRKPGIRFA